MTIALGPFELERPIAAGGMGEIWRGRHVEQNTPVAVKVLSAKHVQNEASRRLFREEIKAMAGLHHPGVIMVFDHGVIPDETSRRSEGRLQAGAAFLAMEYASRGSLKDQRAILPWIHVKSFLLSLLDAHARGVIHRDIKPGNVLLCGPGDVRPGLKLADFGLAHAVDRFDQVAEVTGTPRYMAPEQSLSATPGYSAGARPPLDEACGIYQATGDFSGMASSLRFFGDIARIDNDWERARELFEESQALHEKSGDRTHASSALHGVAEMDRLLGNLDAAEKGYRRVLDLDESRGGYGAVPRLNLSLCQISRGEYLEAREALLALLVVWQRQRKRGFIAICQLALAPAAAGDGDWMAYDRHLTEAIALIAQTGMVDIDLGQCAEKAAELALQAKKPERARRALEVALRNWEQLGDDKRVEAVGAQLDAIAP